MEVGIFIVVFLNLIIGCLAKYGIDIVDKYIDEQFKLRGYISTKKPQTSSEKKLNIMKSFLLSALICWVPIINIGTAIMCWFGYKKIYSDVFSTALSQGEIVKIENFQEEKQTTETGYLQKRIAEVKKFQHEVIGRNQVQAFSELPLDERISVLLKELELAYIEKARQEGIDLKEYEDEFSYCHGEELDEAKKLRLFNPEGPTEG